MQAVAQTGGAEACRLGDVFFVHFAFRRWLISMVIRHWGWHFGAWLTHVDKGVASLGFCFWNDSGEVCEVCDGAKFYSPTSCMWKKTSQRADDMSQDRCQSGAPHEKCRLQTGSHWSVSGRSMNVLISSVSSVTIFQRFSLSNEWLQYFLYQYSIQSSNLVWNVSSLEKSSCQWPRVPFLCHSRQSLTCHALSAWLENALIRGTFYGKRAASGAEIQPLSMTSTSVKYLSTLIFFFKVSFISVSVNEDIYVLDCHWLTSD